MKQYYLKGILLCLSLFVGLNLFAYDALIDGIYYDFNGDDAEVTYRDPRYNSYSGIVVIPESITYNSKTYSVTEIGNNAFNGCTGLTSVAIPSNVFSIGIQAFSGCSGLTTITIPNSVKFISQSAFSRCSSLTSITIPNSVIHISDYAFAICSNLASIQVESGNTFYDSRNDCNAIIETATNTLISGCKNTIIPESVTSIGRNAFEGCSSLTSVTIPNSVTSIGNYAFFDCSGLTSITIPNSVTSIGKEAFRSCSSLTSIQVESGNTYYDSRNDCNAIIETATNTLISGCRNTIIPEGVTSISNYTFSNCSSLTSITIPNSVTSIGDYAFSNCSSLTSITIPNSVTSIGDYAFYNCGSLDSITIPNSVTSIGNCTFYNCSGLTFVTISNSVTSIGNYPFAKCNSLTSITVPIDDLATFCNNKIVYLINSKANKPIKLIDSEENEITDYIVPNSVTSISDRAFFGCSGLTSITIPNSVTSIGEDAFYGCCLTKNNFINNSALTSSNNWGATLCDEETIDGLLISNNTVLKCRFWATSVTIPNSVTSIDSGAFSYCSGLTSVTIPNSVTSINDYTFYGCI